MQRQSHNHNNHSQQQQYQPGEIVELDGWKWQCYCHDGPPSDWENDEKRMVECRICEIEEIWECYGYQTVYENDKELWRDILFVCIGCSGADPLQPPSPHQLTQPNTEPQTQPTAPTTTTTVHVGTVIDNDNNKSNNKNKDEEEENDDNDNNDDDEKKMEIATTKPPRSISISNTATNQQTTTPIPTPPPNTSHIHECDIGRPECQECQKPGSC